MSKTRKPYPRVEVTLFSEPIIISCRRARPDDSPTAKLVNELIPTMDLPGYLEPDISIAEFLQNELGAEILKIVGYKTDPNVVY